MNVMVRFVLAPLQMVVVPLITEVGLGFTVIVALPLRSAAIDVQLASVNVAIV